MHGDRVVARIERVTDRGAEGRILRILERGSATIVGRFEADGSGGGFVVPFDCPLIHGRPDSGRRSSATLSRRHGVGRAHDRYPTAALGPVGIVEVLGLIDEPGVDTEVIIRKHGIAAITSTRR